MRFPFLPDRSENFITLKIDGISGLSVRSGVVGDRSRNERHVNRFINDYPRTVVVTVKSKIRDPDDLEYFHMSNADVKTWKIKERRVRPRRRLGESIEDAADFRPPCPSTGDVKIDVSARVESSRRRPFEVDDALLW